MGEWVANGSFLDSQNSGWLGSQGLRSSGHLYIPQGACSSARLGRVIGREWNIKGKLSSPATGPFYCLCWLSRGLIQWGWRWILLPSLPASASGWDFTEYNKSLHCDSPCKKRLKSLGVWPVWQLFLSRFPRIMSSVSECVKFWLKVNDQNAFSIKSLPFWYRYFHNNSYANKCEK